MGASPAESSRGRAAVGRATTRRRAVRGAHPRRAAAFRRQTTPQRSARTAAAAKQPQATIPATPPKIAAATERPG